MSGFSLVSVFLTMLLSSFPLTFGTLISDLQGSIDAARSQISATGSVEDLRRYCIEIRHHLWWLRLVMMVFIVYFVFYFTIIVGYHRVANLARKALRTLVPTFSLDFVPGSVLESLIGLHQALLKIDVQALDRVLLSAALVLSAVVFWRSPVKVYRRAKSALKDARNQIEFLLNSRNRP
jgi:hypothetical protein